VSNPAPYLPPVTSDVVIDISHYENVSPDFITTANAGIAAVILKATQGTAFIDPTFLGRVAEARAAGLLVGAYHFLDSSNPAEQAAHFLTVAVSEAMVNWLALDWEPYPPSQANAMQAATAAASIQAATGKWPVLYTIRSMLPARIKPSRTARFGWPNMVRGRFARRVSPSGSYGSTRTAGSGALPCRFPASGLATAVSSRGRSISSWRGGLPQPRLNRRDLGGSAGAGTAGPSPICGGR